MSTILKDTYKAEIATPKDQFLSSI